MANYRDGCAWVGVTLCAASLAAAGAAGSLQEDTGTRRSPGDEVTLSGCVVDEATFARATGLGSHRAGDAEAQLVLMRDVERAAARMSYVLTGPRERELFAYTHTQVELSGTVEGPISGPAVVPRIPPETKLPTTGATGVTPQGTPAHEPGDAVRPLPGQPGDATADADRQHSTRADPAGLGDVARLNVRAFRITGGACGPRPQGDAGRNVERPDAPAGVTSTGTNTPQPVGAERATALVEASVTVIGCLLRDSIGGAPGPGDALVLVRAVVLDGSTARESAVPGSVPSGRGSGTVRPREPVAQSTESGGDRALAFALEGHEPELADRVGERLSIAGRIRAASERRDNPSAHSTAPAATLVVETVETAEPTGEACR